MLDDYKISQPIVYKTLVNAVVKNRFSHAYLFETNGFPDKENLALAFAKYLLCPNHHLSHNEAENCHYCSRIKNGNFSEITIINPDGLWIKKDQLVELQKKCSKKAIESQYQIYIINNAECLNSSAANSILKFLEEPEDNIIAILITDNSYQLLETIRSRCQIIPFANFASPVNSELYLNYDKSLVAIANLIVENDEQVAYFINQPKNLEAIVKTREFANYYEKNGKTILLHLNKIWNNYFIDKELLTLGLNIMLLYYKEVLNFLLEKPLEIFFEFENDIDLIAKKNTINTVCYKLKIILDAREKIKGNVNTSLLIDKLIIDFEGGIANV